MNRGRRDPRPFRAGLAALLFCLVLPLSLWGAEAPGKGGDKAPLHPPLGTEGIYDPTNPGIEFLQQPETALSVLPRALLGNQVDWVKAFNEGFIDPLTAVKPGQAMRPIDMDVLMTETQSMPYVKFPHFQHSQWLACSNCHVKIFLPKRNANPVNMYSILNGDYCGVCHGKVAFPLVDCFRCHNMPRDKRALPK